MKIFITGGHGFVGRNLFEFYKDKHEVYLYRKGGDVFEELNREMPDVIINSAAEIYKEELMFESNLELVNQILLHCLSNNRLKRFIQIGSSSEYGRKTDPSSEKDLLEPETIYEGTKAAATLLCVSYAKNYNLPIAVARPYSVYGKYEKPHRLFPRLINAFFKDEPMKLHQGWHDFIYIKDFIRGIDSLITEDKEKVKGDIVNFGSGKQHSNFEIYELFKRITRKDGMVELKDSLSKKFESSRWVCSPEYSLSKYGFKVDFSIENGITDLLKEINYVAI